MKMAISNLQYATLSHKTLLHPPETGWLNIHIICSIYMTRKLQSFNRVDFQFSQVTESQTICVKEIHVFLISWANPVPIDSDHGESREIDPTG